VDFELSPGRLKLNSCASGSEGDDVSAIFSSVKSLGARLRRLAGSEFCSVSIIFLRFLDWSVSSKSCEDLADLAVLDDEIALTDRPLRAVPAVRVDAAVLAVADDRVDLIDTSLDSLDIREDESSFFDLLETEDDELSWVILDLVEVSTLEASERAPLVEVPLLDISPALLDLISLASRTEEGGGRRGELPLVEWPRLDCSRTLDAVPSDPGGGRVGEAPLVEVPLRDLSPALDTLPSLPSDVPDDLFGDVSRFLLGLDSPGARTGLRLSLP